MFIASLRLKSGAPSVQGSLHVTYLLAGAAALRIGKHAGQCTPRIHQLLDERIPHIRRNVRIQLALKLLAQNELAPVGRCRLTGGIGASSS